MPHPFFILPHLTEMYFFRAFYEPSDQEFFITPKNNAIYKHYKNDRYYQLTGIGNASVDFPEGKIWCRPGKIR